MTVLLKFTGNCRQKFEMIAKDAVQRALSEKLETSKALAVAEERLTQIENECGDLQILCEKTQKDLLMLVEKFTTQSETLEEMTQKYQVYSPPLVNFLTHEYSNSNHAIMVTLAC